MYHRTTPSTQLHRVAGRRVLRGQAMGDFSDESPCSSVPAGDPYRKPGNYCATPDGGYTTFNADGSTYQAPTSTTTDSGSIWDKISGALTGALNQRPVAAPGAALPVAGMSTTTKVALAGGLVLVAVLLARR